MMPIDFETNRWRHICVDMQRMFHEDTPWHVDWMDRILPQVEKVCARFADKTIFTRFRPPYAAQQLPGGWQDYYAKWWMMTGAHLQGDMIELVPQLKSFVPPARVFDKWTYGPWTDGKLHALLRKDAVSSLVVTGGETDVCVLATVLGAVDLGYRVTVLSDAVCSGTDTTHDAALKLLADRFSVQLMVQESGDFLAG